MLSDSMLFITVSTMLQKDSAGEHWVIPSQAENQRYERQIDSIYDFEIEREPLNIQRTNLELKLNIQFKFLYVLFN